MRNLYLINVVVAIALLIATGCRPGSSTGTTAEGPSVSSPPSNAPAAVATNLTAADVAKLRWIEGTWRGSGENSQFSYERYKFESDSAIVLEGFADDKQDQVTDTRRFELKNGEFGTVDGPARWAASEIKDDSVTFVRIASDQPKQAPPAGHPSVASDAPRSIRWQNNNNGTWQIVVEWPPKGDQSPVQKTFVMEKGPANDAK